MRAPAISITCIDSGVQASFEADPKAWRRPTPAMIAASRATAASQRAEIDKYLSAADCVLAATNDRLAREPARSVLAVVAHAQPTWPPGAGAVGKPSPSPIKPPLPPAAKAPVSPKLARSIEELVDLASGGDRDAEEELRGRTGYSSVELRTARKAGVKLKAKGER
ncbi:MAG TPA: hypothetical protein VGK67_26380 [Myxococcales bacterium]|jgi:hypothetical protein